MKNITFVVPCYNSESYMHRCIDSLLKAGREAEIIIVNDGSADGTGRIAKEYERNYPDIVRAIEKENGGHGSGVNKGIELAKGTYFKVVDSDDWLDDGAIAVFMERLNQFCLEAEWEDHAVLPDLFICNYIYDHLYEGTSQVMRYRNVFKKEELCTWNDIGHFSPSQYLVMHALIYRTEVLRKSGVQLPEHTFYVDNIFAYQPLPLVEHIYYMDLDLYHYFLGREDQSVNEKVLMSRIDQQIKVTRIVSRCVDLDCVEEKYPKLAIYMRRNISIMMAISSIHLLLIDNDEAYRKRSDLWNDIRSYNRKLYRRLKYTTLSGFTYLPGMIGRKLTVTGYRAARKIYQFN